MKKPLLKTINLKDKKSLEVIKVYSEIANVVNKEYEKKLNKTLSKR